MLKDKCYNKRVSDGDNLKAVLKLKLINVIKLKRTSLLLLLSIVSIISCFILEKALNSYSHIYTVIVILIIVSSISYLSSLLMAKEPNNDLLTFLKINKRKHQFFLGTILLIAFFLIIGFLLALFILVKAFIDYYFYILISLVIGMFGSLLSLVIKKIKEGE